MGVKAGFLGALTIQLMAPTGKCDQKNPLPPGLFADQARGVVAVEFGHRKVEHGHVGLKFSGGFDSFDAVLRDLHFVAVLSQQPREDLSRLGKIIGNEDAAAGPAHSAVAMSRFVTIGNRVFRKRRQMDDEFAAAIDAVAAHFDVAVVHFDQSMNQRETETKPAFGARERAVDLIKQFK